MKTSALNRLRGLGLLSLLALTALALPASAQENGSEWNGNEVQPPWQCTSICPLKARAADTASDALTAIEASRPFCSDPASQIRFDDAEYHLINAFGFLDQIPASYCADPVAHLDTFDSYLGNALYQLGRAASYLETACSRGCGEACGIRNLVLDAQQDAQLARTYLGTCALL